MIDERCRYYSRNGKYVSFITRKEFDSLGELETATLPVVEQLERQAGRKLDLGELTDGFRPVETRDRRTLGLLAIEKAKKEKAEPVNPYRAALDYANRKAETRDEMLERKAQEWEDQRRQEQEQKEREASPTRQKAIALATEQLQRLKYTPGHTVEEREKAEAQLERARSGDLREFRAIDRQNTIEALQKLNERKREFDCNIQALTAEQERITTHCFDAVSPVNAANI